MTENTQTQNNFSNFLNFQANSVGTTAAVSSSFLEDDDALDSSSSFDIFTSISENGNSHLYNPSGNTSLQIVSKSSLNEISPGDNNSVSSVTGPDFSLRTDSEGSELGGGVEALSLPQAHGKTGVDSVHADYGFYGSGQTVVVIDSGIAYDHNNLGGGFGEGHRIVGGYDFAEGDANPYDDGPKGGHGSHVAGIIGSDHETHTGVAPEVDFVALRVFDDQSNGYFSWVEKALQWVKDHQNDFENPITAVTLSLGVKTWNSDIAPSWAMLENEFNLLEQAGIFITISAGNSYGSFNADGLSYPAASKYVTPVMSVNDDGETLSSWSQRHDSAIAAPGHGIASTIPDWKGDQDGVGDDFQGMSGTSMASPYVSGASVLIREAMEFVGMDDVYNDLAERMLAEGFMVPSDNRGGLKVATSVDQISVQDVIYEHMRDTAKTINGGYLSLDVGAAIEALLPEDDFGDIIVDAHDLGQLVADMDLSGIITKVSDVDFFSFVAGVTGVVQLVADVTHNMITTWDGVGTVSGEAGEVFTMDVVQGQTYSVGIGTDKGLGYYDLDITIDGDVVDVPVNEAPDLEVGHTDLANGEVILASTVILASDPEGDDLVYYLTDNNGSQSDAHFMLDGNRLDADVEHQLTADQFSRLEIVGGSVKGSHDFDVRVGDGSLFSQTRNLELVTLNSGPDLGVQNTSVAAGQSVLVSSLVEASDVDGDALTYSVFDSDNGATSGHFNLDGSVLNSFATHTLSADEFSRLEWVGGTSGGVDSVHFQVSDGQSHSNWLSAQFTTENTAPLLDVEGRIQISNGESLLLQDMVQVYDREGQALTYMISDENTESGSSVLYLDGQMLAAGETHELNADQFSRLVLSSGYRDAVDDISIRVSDGDFISQEMFIEVTTRPSYDLQWGTTGDDALYGDDRASYLLGMDGEDVLEGNGGDDGLYGYSGDDEIDGGNGNDHIYGGSGDDLIQGGAGDDLISGGEGQDTLYGGDGADTFIFNALQSDASSNLWNDFDYIKDFEVGVDALDISNILSTDDVLSDAIKVLSYNQDEYSGTYLLEDNRDEGAGWNVLAVLEGVVLHDTSEAVSQTYTAKDGKAYTASSWDWVDVQNLVDTGSLIV